MRCFLLAIEKSFACTKRQFWSHEMAIQATARQRVCRYTYIYTLIDIYICIYIHTYIYVHIYIEFTGSYTNTFIYVMYMYLRSYNPNKMRWGRPHQFWRISGIYWRILSTGGYKVLMLPHHIHNPHSNILGLQIIWAVLSFAVLLFWQTCFVWMPLCFPAHAGWTLLLFNKSCAFLVTQYFWPWHCPSWTNQGGRGEGGHVKKSQPLRYVCILHILSSISSIDRSIFIPTYLPIYLSI